MVVPWHTCSSGQSCCNFSASLHKGTCASQMQSTSHSCRAPVTLSSRRRQVEVRAANAGSTPADAHSDKQQQQQVAVRTLQQLQQAHGLGNHVRQQQPHNEQQKRRHQQQQQQEQQQHPSMQGQLLRPQHHQQTSRPQQQRRQQQQQMRIPQLLPLPGPTPPLVAAAAAARQQQQQQQQLLPHPFCTLAPALLTSSIKQCSSWHETAVLFAKQSLCMNHINLAALLCHLAHLRCSVGSRPVNWRSYLEQVLRASEPQLNLCSTRQLSNMAWALASLGFDDWVSPGYSWTQQWRQRLLHTLHGASCRDVSNILWALATSIGSSSGSGSSGSNSRRQPLVLQPQADSVLCEGVLLQELLSALHRELPHSSSQDVANAMWAVATLQLSPSPELQQYLLIKTQAHFSDLKPQEVANFMWALGQLQLQPSAAWLQELLLRQVGRSAWHATKPQHQVMCLVGCAHLRHMPPEKWIAQTLNQLQQQLLLREAASVRSSSSSRSNSSSNWDSSSRLRHSSSSSSTTSSSSSSSSMSQDLANTMWALGTLRIRPNITWMQQFYSASTPCLAGAQPQELCNTIWGLAKLKTTPEPAWLDAFDAASSACMTGFTAQGLGDVLAAQAHLKLQPSGAWREVWMQALQRCWGSADAPAVCKALWAAAKFQLPLGRAWLQAALQQSHEELQRALLNQELVIEDLLRLVWAVGRLCRGLLTQEMSDMLGLHCCRAAAKMSWQQLHRGAWGLARLKPLPNQQLVEYYSELAGSKCKYMPEQQAQVVNEKLELLKNAAELARMRAVLQEMGGHRSNGVVPSSRGSEQLAGNGGQQRGAARGADQAAAASVDQCVKVNVS